MAKFLENLFRVETLVRLKVLFEEFSAPRNPRFGFCPENDSGFFGIPVVRSKLAAQDVNFNETYYFVESIWNQSSPEFLFSLFLPESGIEIRYAPHVFIDLFGDTSIELILGAGIDRYLKHGVVNHCDAYA